MYQLSGTRPHQHLSYVYLSFRTRASKRAVQLCISATAGVIMLAIKFVLMSQGQTKVRMSSLRRCAAALLGGATAFASAAGGAQTSDAVPAFKTADSIEARVQGCVTCHGQSGQGTTNGYYPRIAGKPAGYLYNQLAAFRDGTRQYPPMNYLVAYLPDAYLKDIATYFSKQRPPFSATEPSTSDAATVAKGQALVFVGDQKRGLPACSTCHGEALTGMEPGIPGLFGLRPTYIVAQLNRWRIGERHAMEPDCMKRVASKLSDEDITAVAAWLSQQPAPKDASPESSNLVRMPFACGSQQR